MVESLIYQFMNNFIIYLNTKFAKNFTKISKAERASQKQKRQKEPFD